MTKFPFKIVPMKSSHIPACDVIVRSSEPWKTLREGVDLKSAVRRKEAYVAEIAGAVAGFVVFTSGPVFARGGYLRAIGVAEAIRSSGVGRKLLSFAELKTAKKTANLYLCVSSFNRDAQAFYRRCGYRKVGSIDGLVRKGLSEQIYWKRLRRQAAGRG